MYHPSGHHQGGEHSLLCSCPPEERARYDATPSFAFPPPLLSPSLPHHATRLAVFIISSFSILPFLGFQKKGTTASPSIWWEVIVAYRSPSCLFPAFPHFRAIYFFRSCGGQVGSCWLCLADKSEWQAFHGSAAGRNCHSTLVSILALRSVPKVPSGPETLPGLIYGVLGPLLFVPESSPNFTVGSVLPVCPFDF